MLIKKKLKLFHFLHSYKGFSNKTVSLISYECGISLQSYTANLTKIQQDFILNWIDANLAKKLFGSKLVQFGIAFKKQLKNINTVKSVRFFRGLPVRGQRTKTNGKTAKKLNG